MRIIVMSEIALVSREFSYRKGATNDIRNHTRSCRPGCWPRLVLGILPMIPHIEAGDKWVHVGGNFPVQETLDQNIRRSTAGALGVVKRKADVLQRYVSGYVMPAINVKIYRSPWEVELPLVLGSTSSAPDFVWEPIHTEPEFNRAWIEAHQNAFEWAWDITLEDSWRVLEAAAAEIFGRDVQLFQDGRSGSWAVVQGLEHVENWDAIALGRWARFAKRARQIADDVPRAALETLYYNVFDETTL